MSPEMLKWYARCFTTTRVAPHLQLSGETSDIHCAPFTLFSGYIPSRFFLFPKLKTNLKWRRFYTMEEMSLIRRTACARAQFSGCRSTTNAHCETEKMVECCQKLTLGVLSSCNALTSLIGALFRKFCIFITTLVFLVPINSSPLTIILFYLIGKTLGYNDKICLNSLMNL